MKRIVAFGMLAVAQMLVPNIVVGAVVFDFHDAESLTFTNCSFYAIAQNRAGFTFANYSNFLSIAIREYQGEQAAVFKNDNETHCDTAWSLTTPRFPVQDGKTYAVKVRTRSDIRLKTTKPMSAILWYRADGKELLAQNALGQDSPVSTPMPIRTSSEAYRDSAVSGIVPKDAAFASVKICSDRPDLESGQVVLTQVVLGHKRRRTLAALLVVVGSKVLGTGNSLEILLVIALHALNELYGQLTCQIGVFTVVLLITSPAWVTCHIDGGAPVVQAFVI